MARARNIKPGMYKNEDLAECSIWARYIFPGIWMMADREGRLEDRPKRIKVELLPYDEGTDVDSLLNELETRGFILRYSVDGQGYIQVLKFSEHQTPHVREQASTYPSPPCMVQSTAKVVPDTCLDDNEASPRSPDSLIPSSLIPDTGLEDSTPQASAPAKPKRTRKAAATPLPEDFCISENVRTWAREKGHQHLERHFESFVTKVKAKGYTYADWDAALRNAIADDWAKIGQQARASPQSPGISQLGKAGQATAAAAQQWLEQSNA
ncbi:hypothetical protein [Herbaspirillum robiniae]|uniref:hypothetical protein n=1 Tax=Herbaspirillum robiniae TaxID=2014887 RepID=UPI0009A20FBE|nr:hypothetical protein [Herbaspirillum robiniae]